jgi:hypothetical protein
MSKTRCFIAYSPGGQANSQSKTQTFTVFDLLVIRAKYSNHLMFLTCFMDNNFQNGSRGEQSAKHRVHINQMISSEVIFMLMGLIRKG